MISLLPADGEKRLVGEQLDAALGVVDVGDVDLLALGLEVGEAPSVQAALLNGRIGSPATQISPALRGSVIGFLQNLSSPLTS